MPNIHELRAKFIEREMSKYRLVHVLAEAMKRDMRGQQVTATALQIREIERLRMELGVNEQEAESERWQ
jgi:hypothetical protein